VILLKLVFEEILTSEGEKKSQRKLKNPTEFSGKKESLTIQV